jgi:hypothetical protein
MTIWFSSIPTLLCIILFFAYRREVKKHMALGRWGIAHDKGYVPTYAQDLAKPVEVSVFGKSLYIGCLSFEAAEIWLKEVGRFYAECSMWLSDFDVDKLQEDSKGTAVNKLSHKLYNAVYNRRFRMAFMRLMRKTVLADAVLNPYRVSGRKLYKWLNHYNVAEILWVLFSYNHGGHVKKNYRQLFQSLQMVSSGICDIQSQSPWSKAESIMRSVSNRLYGTPYAYAPDSSLNMSGATQEQGASDDR